MTLVWLLGLTMFRGGRAGVGRGGNNRESLVGLSRGIVLVWQVGVVWRMYSSNFSPDWISSATGAGRTVVRLVHKTSSSRE